MPVSLKIESTMEPITLDRTTVITVATERPMLLENLEEIRDAVLPAMKLDGGNYKRESISYDLDWGKPGMRITMFDRRLSPGLPIGGADEPHVVG